MLQVEGLSKTYVTGPRKTRQAFEALKDVSFSVDGGECLTVIGPSGCGKTTILKIVAGLESSSGGRVTLDGSLIDGPSRDCAVVFQQASLLPWRTVQSNVEYGLQLRRALDRNVCRERAADALATVGLADFAQRYPHELSGGMQQRVNLARALAVHPKLLLMDEPFSALDGLTKESLQDELLRISEDVPQQRMTFFVTHDVEEAAYLGDKVMVMAASPGRVVTVLPVELPWPRDRDVVETREFQAIVRELRGMLVANRAGRLSSKRFIS